MVIVEIGNSVSQIKGLQTGLFNKLRKELSYQADPQAAYFSRGGFNGVRYCIDVKGVFLTGLLNRTLLFLKREKIEYSILDNRIVPIRKVNHKPSLKGIIPYSSQLKAVEAADIYARGIISMPTGSGKSLVIALIAARLNVRTLVVVPSLQIKEQLTGALNAIFQDMSNIAVENIDSAALKQSGDYDCLIIDEAHHVAAKTYQKLNKTVWKDIYHRFFTTATPFRNQTEETLLFEGLAGQVIYSLLYKEAVRQKFIVPIEAYYIEASRVKTDAFTWAQVYSELVNNNLAKNRLIAKTLISLESADISTLCLVREIKHGDNLAALTNIPFANGQDETTRHYIEKFNSGKIKSLIGTTGILGEGVDTKPCEFVVIAGLGKAKSAFMQQVGRGIRTYPGKESAKIVLIKDSSHKFLLRHFKEQCRILKEEYGVIPTKLEI